MIDITKDVDEQGRFYMESVPVKYRVKNQAFKPIVFSDPKKQYAYEKQNPREFDMFVKTKVDGVDRYYLPRSAYYSERHESLFTTGCRARLDMIQDQLYDYQYEAVDTMLKTIDTSSGGLIVSGTGTGKTRMLRALAKSLEKPIVLVVPNNVVGKNAVEGFADLGYELIHIHGDQEAKDLEIDPNKSYVCHYSTLDLNYDKLNDGTRALVCDEAHMCPCDTLLKAICMWKNQEQSSCVFGVTATNYRKELDADAFKKLFGTVHDTKQEALPVNVLCIKKDRVYDLEYAMKCQEGLSPDSPEVRVRLLDNDESRMQEIIDMAMRCYHRKGDETGKVIVFTYRTDFAKRLYKKLENLIGQGAKLLIGETSNQDIKKSVAKLNQYIIVANVKCAGEGLDIPALDTGILTFITKDKKSLAQMAGRVRRASEGKSCGYFIDFMDTIKVGPTRPINGGGNERRKMYGELGFSIQDI